MNHLQNAGWGKGPIDPGMPYCPLCTEQFAVLAGAIVVRILNEVHRWLTASTLAPRR